MRWVQGTCKSHMLLWRLRETQLSWRSGCRSQKIPEHPGVAITYLSIGAIHAQKGDKPKALAYLQKAKAIQLKKLGPNHPHTKSTQLWIDEANRE